MTAAWSRWRNSARLVEQVVVVPPYVTAAHAGTRPATEAPRSLSTSAVLSSGHNKWSKIRHKKTANDTARAKTYSGLSREIVSSIRNHPSHSSSPDTNARLATLLRKARDMDFPKDKIEATIRKAESIGSGGAGGTSISFEALGPNSKEGNPVALIVCVGKRRAYGQEYLVKDVVLTVGFFSPAQNSECLTDSPARTRSKVKEIFNKNHVRVSSTSHLFERKGVIRLIAKAGASFDDVFMAAVELGAEEVREWEDAEEEMEEEIAGLPIEILCESSQLHTISSALAAPPHEHALHVVEAQMLPVGPPLRVEQSDDDANDAGQATQEASGYVSGADVERLDRVLDLLMESADTERCWSNIAGWPAR